MIFKKYKIFFLIIYNHFYFINNLVLILLIAPPSDCFINYNHKKIRFIFMIQNKNRATPCLDQKPNMTSITTLKLDRNISIDLIHEEAIV